MPNENGLNRLLAQVFHFKLSGKEVLGGQVNTVFLTGTAEEEEKLARFLIVEQH